MSTNLQYLRYVEHRDRRLFSLKLILFIILRNCFKHQKWFPRIKKFLLTFCLLSLVFSLFIYSFDLLHHSVHVCLYIFKNTAAYWMLIGENYWLFFVSLYSVRFIFSLLATLCPVLPYYIKSSTYNFIFSKKRQWTRGCI